MTSDYFHGQQQEYVYSLVKEVRSCCASMAKTFRPYLLKTRSKADHLHLYFYRVDHCLENDCPVLLMEAALADNFFSISLPVYPRIALLSLLYFNPVKLRNAVHLNAMT